MPDTTDITWGIDHRALRRYYRDLPHWRQEGVVYYTTIRLADSIPRAVVEDWLHDRRTWLATHGITANMPEAERRRRYLAIPEGVRRTFEREQKHRYFIELDRCHGACWLRRPQAAEAVAKAFRFYDGTRLHCGDFVVMPNHAHWLLIPFADEDLETILKSVKQYSSSQVNLLAGRTGRLWKKESFDHIVRSPEELDRIRTYIEQNPVKAGLKSGQYFYHRVDWL